MTARPDQAGTPSVRPGDTADAKRVSVAAHRLQVAALQCHIAALERKVEIERERRRAVVTRYEQLLNDR